MARFHRKTLREGECLVWQAQTNADGYPLFYADRKHHSAHRWIYEQTNGPIPDGMQLDHACWTRACVEVSHLRLATPNQNAAYRKGASANNKSTGIRNVYLVRGRYAVRIRKDGALIDFGSYETANEAECVAEANRRSLFGNFAGHSNTATPVVAP